MNMILQIISGLVVLNIVVIVHEFGHYITAIKAKVYAPKFAIGFGPTIWTIYQNKQTSFELKAIPFGGFVALASKYENEETIKKIPENYHSLEDISKWKQIWIISAGAIFNFIFAAMLYFVIGLVSGHTTSNVVIDQVQQNTPAAQVLQKNDTILKVNNNEITNPNLLGLYIDKQNVIEVKRNNKIIKLNVSGFKNEQNNKLYRVGIVTKVANVKAKNGIMGAIDNVGGSFKDVINLQLMTFKMLFSGRAKISDMSGPVGIIRSTGTIVSQKQPLIDKVMSFLNWMAMISIAIGFANIALFILPIVDGGRIFLIILSAILKKDLSQTKVVTYLMNLCIILMLSFFVYITLFDLFRHM